MDELFAIEDEYDREIKYQQLQTVADRFKVRGKFDRLYRARNKVEKKKTPAALPTSNVTNFTTLDEQFYCGNWIADNNGIKVYTDKGIAQAAYHPIYPTRILCNAETGTYKVELEFMVRGQVRHALVDKDVIASPQKILKLANESVMVTSNNAPYLVQFLMDVESLNPDMIKEVTSTSRLGWIEDIGRDGLRTKKFLPYDSEVVFDNEQNTKSLFDSIKEVGLRQKWYDILHEVRAKRQTEVLINLAASFSSVLVEPCGALPFIVSLWGGTGIGKTVVLILATSVWADPNEGAYMTDAKATSTAMEIRLGILNSLPMTLDDMAQVKNQYDEDFSQLIYRWCAGKGRERSNTNLGLNKLTSWRNCTITNGERSLIDESTQGGAVNRVIDIESDGSILFSGEYGNRVAETLRHNFGFAGREFITVIETLGFEAVKKIMDGYYSKIKEIAQAQGCEKEDKQIMPMALILTADEIAEQYLFKDGVRLDIEKCVRYLKDKGEVSEHKRAYEYMRDMIVANSKHLQANANEPLEGNIEVWGYYRIEKDIKQVVIIGTVFERVMKQGGFQARAFLSWAAKKGLVEAGDGKHRKKYARINRDLVRCVFLNLEADIGEDFDEGLDDIPF